MRTKIENEESIQIVIHTDWRESRIPLKNNFIWKIIENGASISIRRPVESKSGVFRLCDAPDSRRATQECKSNARINDRLSHPLDVITACALFDMDRVLAGPNEANRDPTQIAFSIFVRIGVGLMYTYLVYMNFELCMLHNNSIPWRSS